MGGKVVSRVTFNVPREVARDIESHAHQGLEAVVVSVNLSENETTVTLEYGDAPMLPRRRSEYVAALDEALDNLTWHAEVCEDPEHNVDEPLQLLGELQAALEGMR
jgi:chaperonin cofactor prefoldin